MSVETYDVAADVVTVTPEAARHLKRQLEVKGGNGVRVSVKESGCTGYMYVMEEVDAAAGNDLTVELDNGVRLFVDSGSLGILRGTEIDYAREGVNRSIRFNNPNVTAACGCGESFTTN